jgi:hypothetical protein
MKTKYLDARNCHKLLPLYNSLPIASRLEECLHQINDKNKKYLGLIDKLVERNKKTINKFVGVRRLLSVPVDIAQGINVTERTIHTQALERPEKSPLLFNMVFDYPNQTSWKVILPLQYLLKGWGDANRGYQSYVHTIAQNLPKLSTAQQLIQREADQSNNYNYVGITGRNWLLRLGEHLREITSGNRRTFYKAWRENLGLEDVLFISQLSDINLEYKDAMDWEEIYVDKIGSGSNGLNMIPGGFKGLKYLHKLRITRQLNISLEDRDKALGEYLRQNPRKGIPNPFISELWENDDYYLRVIEARPKTLSADQVREIRTLGKKGCSISQITKDVKALNETQVKNVLSGKTYKRVH